jgi:2-dehydro-3-deoxygluconokinase
MTRVVCIGECMLEFRAPAGHQYELGFAGDVFNTAVYLKRSARRFDVQFLTVTGTDRFSQAMRGRWREEGVGDELAFAAEDALPGLYVISVDAAGERSFTYWRSASAARRWLDHLERAGGADRLAGAELVYLSGISLAILPAEQRARALELLRTLRRRGCRVAFDPNFRRALWTSMEDARQVLGDAMQVADMVLPSQDDLDATGLTVPPGCECVTTRGAGGCRVQWGATVVTVEAPAVKPTRVVDTSGAGDSFNGAYLAARLSGAEPAAAAAAGLAVAARVVTAPGAVVTAAVSHAATS